MGSEGEVVEERKGVEMGGFEEPLASPAEEIPSFEEG